LCFYLLLCSGLCFLYTVAVNAIWPRGLRGRGNKQYQCKGFAAKAFLLSGCGG